MTDTAPGYVHAPWRARIAQLALIIHVVASVALHATQALVLTLYGQQGYRQDVDGLEQLTHGAISLVVFGVSMFVLLRTVAVPIAVLTWLHRASKNAHAIAKQPLEHSPGMAIGWWLVPFANLWQPLAVVREIDTTSDPEESFIASPDTSWWWGTYLLGNVAAFLGSEILRPSEATITMGVLATIAHVISATALIRIIERIRKNQEISSRRRRWAEVFDDEDEALAS